MQLVAFEVGESLLGIDVRRVEEINRQVRITPTPQSPPEVRGVINLRGEVVTVLDGRVLAGCDRTTATSASERCILLHAASERVGLLVDRVADILEVSDAEVDDPPANLGAWEQKHCRGVCPFEQRLLAIVDVDSLLA